MESSKLVRLRIWYIQKIQKFQSHVKPMLKALDAKAGCIILRSAKRQVARVLQFYTIDLNPFVEKYKRCCLDYHQDMTSHLFEEHAPM